MMHYEIGNRKQSTDTILSWIIKHFEDVCIKTEYTKEQTMIVKNTTQKAND
jgi:hypothetical protein